MSLESALRETNAYVWVVTAPEYASLRASTTVAHHLKSKGFNVRSVLMNRTPSLLTQLTQEQSLDDLLQIGVQQLSRTFKNHTQLQALSLSVLQEEVDRARDALELIRSHTERLPMTLIEELNPSPTPTDMIRQLSERMSTLDEFALTSRCD